MSDSGVTAMPDTDLQYALKFVELHSAADICFVSGSFIRPWKNAGSDIDLYVIQDVSAPKARPTDIRWCEEFQTKVDVTYVTASGMQSLLALANDRCGHPPARWDDDVSLSRFEVDLLCRISAGRALTNVSGFEAIREATALVCPQIAARYWLLFARNSWLDAAGAFQSGDYLQALMDARRCLLEITDAYCALNGVASVSTKWRYQTYSILPRDPLGIKDAALGALFGSKPAASSEGWAEPATQTLLTAGATITAVEYHLITRDWIKTDHTEPAILLEPSHSSLEFQSTRGSGLLCSPPMSHYLRFLTSGNTAVAV